MRRLPVTNDALPNVACRATPDRTVPSLTLSDDDVPDLPCRAAPNLSLPDLNTPALPNLALPLVASTGRTGPAVPLLPDALRTNRNVAPPAMPRVSTRVHCPLRPASRRLPCLACPHVSIARSRPASPILACGAAASLSAPQFAQRRLACAALPCLTPTSLAGPVQDRKSTRLNSSH